MRGGFVGATERIGMSGVTDWGTTLLGCFDVQAPLCKPSSEVVRSVP